MTHSEHQIDVMNQKVFLPCEHQVDEIVKVVTPDGEIKNTTVGAVRFYEEKKVKYDLWVKLDKDYASLAEVDSDIVVTQENYLRPTMPTNLPEIWNSIPVYEIKEKVSFLGNDCTVTCVIFTDKNHYYDLQLPGGCIIEYVDQALLPIIKETAVAGL